MREDFVTDGITNGRTYGRTDGCAYRCTDGCTHRYTDGCAHCCAYCCTHCCADGCHIRRLSAGKVNSWRGHSGNSIAATRQRRAGQWQH